MVLAFKFGLTVRAMKASGVLTKQMGRESSTMLMVMSMKANGSTTKLKELVVTHTLMEHIMRENGMMINNMDTELNLGLMVHDTTEFT